MTVLARHEPEDRLEEKLESYSRQARARGRSHPLALRAGFGTLAAIVPLAAAAGDASAQSVNCSAIVPSTIDLTLTNTTGSQTVASVFSVTGGAAYQGVIRMYGNSNLGEVRIVVQGGGWDIGTDLGKGAVRSSSQTFSGQGWFMAELCAAAGTTGSGSVINGPFCPPVGTAYLGIQTPGGHGFIELEIVSISGGQVSLRLGYLQSGTSPAHAGDCPLPLPLPVELVSFTGVSDQGKPVLTWETASELNNAGFEIERASGSEQFRRLAFVEGIGTTTEPQSYSYADESAQPNALYRYRLKQIDLDGTTSYSPIVELFTEAPDVVAVSDVFPNPATGRGARVDINLAQPGDAVVEVYDVRGALVRSDARVLNRGQNRMRLDTDGLARGAHFVKMQIGERVVYRPFVVVD